MDAGEVAVVRRSNILLTKLQTMIDTLNIEFNFYLSTAFRKEDSVLKNDIEASYFFLLAIR